MDRQRPLLSSDDRLPAGRPLRFSVEVGASTDFESSPLQLRGVVKNAIVDALASRGVAAEVQVEHSSARVARSSQQGEETPRRNRGEPSSRCTTMKTVRSDGGSSWTLVVEEP
jgi:hypothetical protein